MVYYLFRFVILLNLILLLLLFIELIIMLGIIMIHSLFYLIRNLLDLFVNGGLPLVFFFVLGVGRKRRVSCVSLSYLLFIIYLLYPLYPLDILFIYFKHNHFILIIKI